MTRVDFYVLPDADADNRNTLICKLAEKAFRHDKPVFIHADDQSLLQQLDDHLWNFRRDSFVPHRLLEGSNANPLNEPDDSAANVIANAEHSQIDTDPVQLSTGGPSTDRVVLINLASKVPPFFSRFERALEVINQADSVRDSARERYRFYQQRGYPLKTHKM